LGFLFANASGRKTPTLNEISGEATMFENIKQKYNTIVIDPPWDISMTGKTALRPNRAKELPYKTMSLDEIKKIPIGRIANQGAHIYCWTTNKMLKDTFDVLESWGVNFHLVLVWVKPSAIAPCFAYKFATEFCLLGFFGKPMQKFKKNCQLNWIKATPVRNGHSAKPDEFYNLIREMSPEPMIDIFARKPRVGFNVWGDEIASPETQATLSALSFNKDLTATQQVASPKSASQTSLNPNIKSNFGACQDGHKKSML